MDGDGGGWQQQQDKQAGQQDSGSDKDSIAHFPGMGMRRSARPFSSLIRTGCAVTGGRSGRLVLPVPVRWKTDSKSVRREAASAGRSAGS